MEFVWGKTMYISGKYIFLMMLSLFLVESRAFAEYIHPSIYLLLLDDRPDFCDAALDSDNDRLNDCVETNTGVFVNKKNSGTNPLIADTDGDGIKDGDEVLGTLGGLRLQAMGANPLRKNIFIEYDWFNDIRECGFHSHKPTPDVIEKVARAFAKAPVTNPDGSKGIEIIQDYGQGGIFSGGNKIVDADGLLNGGVASNEFITHKTLNFAPNRLGYFHYMLFPHRYNTSSVSSGQAELPGDDSLVSLYCLNSTRNVSHTIMHELGHNLNLRHGGNVNCNYKPNYNSVMNYRFQFNGIDKNSSCDAYGDGVLSFSTGDRARLNEKKLNEHKGVCTISPIDWDKSGHFSSPVQADVNSEEFAQYNRCGGSYSVLKDYNDWDNLVFLNSTSKARTGKIIQEIITETNIPE